MKALFKTAGSALLIGMALSGDVNAQPDTGVAQSPPKVCLTAQYIQRTERPDDRTIIFHMRDGKVWRNTLRSACPMLKVSPWTWVLQTDQVCSNQQFIHVAMTGDTCPLGDFTPMPPDR